MSLFIKRKKTTKVKSTTTKCLEENTDLVVNPEIQKQVREGFLLVYSDIDLYLLMVPDEKMEKVCGGCIF